ncbi:hypothetical protein ABB37_00157 [Leptomonas pyrrhocoris]|uniref:Uncharacterized protein n=1 Tax=Leptomonas pyrrhocoris TaxID=157538 RepID=A0A0M9GA68_LEPPY|nr:hypothetical protein ABB37_00157 [Leptomonas pyrrhocoris]KPA85816.1 hypothetical protein ABB37_00157 [Leptomonas pyrrhocoris]|eukprot:XP_015664255.1 hypothetical protein ABB37_00157 [Leptomonas pyrrhocoris]
MSSATVCSHEIASGDAQRFVPARSYYSLISTNARAASISLSSPSRLPEVTASANSSGTATLLSRPPIAESLHTLSEVSENVNAPVPIRAPLVPRVLPVLPCTGSPTKAEGSVFALHTASPDSVFRPAKVNASSRSPCDALTSGEKVKPKLCPPMKPTRATPIVSPAARTNPFCPEGVQVNHLPCCTPRVLAVPRVYGRHAPAAHTSSMERSAAALWKNAASDADVLAFFSSNTNTADTTPAGTPPAATPSSSSAPNSGRADKEFSWPAAEMTQSSLCDLSLSEDMFSMDTSSSDGSAGCGHRGSVIDVEALANFQRDGARRQREIFGVACTKLMDQ